MSFSHLTSSRPSNAASDDAPVTPTSAFAQASIGPGSYLPLANWPGKQSPDLRPVTSFGTSVEPEAPRHARLDRDPSALSGDSYIVREHRELLSRSSDKAERTKKRLESAAARESRSPGRPSVLEAYSLRVPRPLGEKLRKERELSHSPPKDNSRLRK